MINICCRKRFGMFCVPLMNAPSAQMDCRVPAVARKFIILTFNLLFLIGKRITSFISFFFLFFFFTIKERKTRVSAKQSQKSQHALNLKHTCRAFF